MSKQLGELVVKECKADEFKGECDIVFSGLDSDIAGDTGMLQIIRDWGQCADMVL